MSKEDFKQWCANMRHSFRLPRIKEWQSKDEQDSWKRVSMQVQRDKITHKRQQSYNLVEYRSGNSEEAKSLSDKLSGSSQSKSPKHFKSGNKPPMKFNSIGQFVVEDKRFEQYDFQANSSSNNSSKVSSKNRYMVLKHNPGDDEEYKGDYKCRPSVSDCQKHEYANKLDIAKKLSV